MFRSINEWARDTPWLHGVVKAYASYGVILFALLLLAGYLVGRQQRSPRQIAAAVWAGIATLVAVAINQPVASGIDEPRPYAVFHDILVLGHRSTDPSFASDHATMAGAVAVGLLIVSVRLGAAAAVAALLMAFARVYVGAHFPVDVLAGLVLGGLVAGLGWLVVRMPLQAVVRRVTRSPLRTLAPTVG
jgi:undecaprenyl-diphosphatase